MKTVSQIEQKTKAVNMDVKEAIPVREKERGMKTAIKPELKDVGDRKEEKRGGTVCIAYGNGCPRSRMSAAKLSLYFGANGWNIEEDIKKADLVLVSTCGVNQRAEKKSLRLLAIANRKKKADTRMVVVGCLAGINPEVLVEKFDPIVIAPIETEKLDDLIGAKIKLKILS